MLSCWGERKKKILSSFKHEQLCTYVNNVKHGKRAETSTPMSVWLRYVKTSLCCKCYFGDFILFQRGKKKKGKNLRANIKFRARERRDHSTCADGSAGRADSCPRSPTASWRSSVKSKCLSQTAELLTNCHCKQSLYLQKQSMRL